MPLCKPDNIERNIYNETQNTLLNAANMISSILDRSRDSCITNIRAESIGDILKLSNAYSAIHRVALENEKWEYQKSCQIEETKKQILGDVKHLMKNKYPDLYEQFQKIVQESADQQIITLRAHIDPRAMLSAPPDVNEEDNAAS